MLGVFLLPAFTRLGHERQDLLSAMKCMYAQTRPRFILSSEGVLEFEPMLTPREKSPLPKMSPEEDRTRDAVDSEPKHYQLSYSGPSTDLKSGITCNTVLSCQRTTGRQWQCHKQDSLTDIAKET